tara:strand:- start:791 stop:1135 length:345 start_codon:yes stop_codon:yes gene_type:complete
MDLLNLIFGLLSIGLGAFGWLLPRYTLETLHLTTHTDTMGLSEIRASAGALFVGMGAGAIYLNSTDGYALLGFCWIGAAIGRATSILLDGATRKKIGFFVVEAVVGFAALAYNI